MAKTIESYRKSIVKALKRVKIYSKGLDYQIMSLASALRTLDMSNDQIDALEETTVLESTRYGKKLAPHPVFKIQKDAQDSITRQMKILGLTAEDLTGSDESDPLIELTKEVKAAVESKKVRIVRRSEAKGDE